MQELTRMNIDIKTIIVNQLVFPKKPGKQSLMRLFMRKIIPIDFLKEQMFVHSQDFEQAFSNLIFYRASLMYS